MFFVEEIDLNRIDLDAVTSANLTLLISAEFTNLHSISDSPIDQGSPVHFNQSNNPSSSGRNSSDQKEFDSLHVIPSDPNLSNHTSIPDRSSSYIKTTPK